MHDSRFIEVQPDRKGGTVLLAIEHIVEVRRWLQGDVAYAAFHLVNHSTIKTYNPFDEVINFLDVDPTPVPTQLPMDEPAEITPPKPRPFGSLPDQESLPENGGAAVLDVEGMLREARS